MKNKPKRPRRTYISDEFERIQNEIKTKGLTEELEKAIKEKYGDNGLFYLKNNDNLDLDK